MELIKEPAPIFEKKLFLKSLHEYKEGVNFKILKVGNIFKSKMNGKPNFFIDMEILSNFKLYITKTNYNPYYKLVPITEKEF